MKANRYLNISALLIATMALSLFIGSLMQYEEYLEEAPWLLNLDLSRFIGGQEVVLPDQMNILVIGIDSRKGSKTEHCDAIHMIHFNIAEDKVEFINVPRGTYTYIPNQPVEEQYLANVCEFIGREDFVRRIEEITGYKADYQIAVGFSQAQGILRALKFDPTTTLQFLRHRQSFSIGDNQRSYNQSVFLTDLYKNRIDFIDNIPDTAQFALYQFVDTDMPYKMARAFLDWANESESRTIEGRITHRTAPTWAPKAKEMHYDEEHPKEQLGELYTALKYYKPDFSVKDLQNEIIQVVDNSIQKTYKEIIEGDIERASKELEIIVNQQIWHQIEDNEKRIQTIESVAILQSTIAWYQTHNEKTTLKLATSLIWSLEMEEGTEDTVIRIKDHLTKLLS